jgi:hypothetical protein
MIDTLTYTLAAAAIAGALVALMWILIIDWKEHR